MNGSKPTTDPDRDKYTTFTMSLEDTQFSHGCEMWSKQAYQTDRISYVSLSKHQIFSSLALYPIFFLPFHSSLVSNTTSNFPHGKARQAIVSALLQCLWRYLPSQHAAMLETEKHINTYGAHTVETSGLR